LKVFGKIRENKFNTLYNLIRLVENEKGEVVKREMDMNRNYG